jgi:hypothetical protein
VIATFFVGLALMLAVNGLVGPGLIALGVAVYLFLVAVQRP